MGQNQRPSVQPWDKATLKMLPPRLARILLNTICAACGQRKQNLTTSHGNLGKI
jgi:hypothetical protein